MGQAHRVSLSEHMYLPLFYAHSHRRVKSSLQLSVALRKTRNLLQLANGWLTLRTRCRLAGLAEDICVELTNYLNYLQRHRLMAINDGKSCSDGRLVWPILAVAVRTISIHDCFIEQVVRAPNKRKRILNFCLHAYWIRCSYEKGYK